MPASQIFPQIVELKIEMLYPSLNDIFWFFDQGLCIKVKEKTDSSSG